MRVLLDTHVLIQAAITGLDHFPASVRDILSDDSTVRLISTVSMTEIAVKANIGKLRLTVDAMQVAIAEMQLVVLAFEAFHAIHLFGLPLLHRDPFDRMLISTSLGEKVPVVTADRAFKQYEAVGLNLIDA